jgi:hypothetical protein
VLTPEVTEGTWAALCDPASAVHGLVAEQEDQLAGLAYLVLHPATGPRTRPATWKTSTPPSSGAAATLQTGSSRPSTHPTGSARQRTQEYNAPARSLYDTLAHRTSFSVYRR